MMPETSAIVRTPSANRRAISLNISTQSMALDYMKALGAVEIQFNTIGPMMRAFRRAVDTCTLDLVSRFRTNKAIIQRQTMAGRTDERAGRSTRTRVADLSTGFPLCIQPPEPRPNVDGDSHGSVSVVSPVG